MTWTYFMEETTASNTLSLLRGLVFSGILVYLLPLQWGTDGIWLAMTITEFAVVILSVFCLRAAGRGEMTEAEK